MDPQPRKRFGPLEKILVGCGVGCGLLVVAAVVAGSLGLFWVFAPGEQVATDLIVGEESLGVVRMNELATDPGTQQLLDKMGQVMADVSRRQNERLLPEEVKWLSGLQRPASARDFNRLIPKEVTLVLEPDADEDGVPEFVVAANFRTMVRPVKAMISLAARDEEAREFRSEYRGQDVYRTPLDDLPDAALAFVGSTLLFSGSRASLEKAIDRVLDPVPGRMEEMTRELPEGTWDAVGVLPDVGEAVVELTREYSADPDFDPPGGAGSKVEVRFGLDVASADEISGQVIFDFEDPRLAEAWLGGLEKAFEGLVTQASELGMELGVETVVRGGAVEAELLLTGLEAAVENTVQFDTGP